MVEAAMGMSAAQFQNTYAVTLLKRSMDDAESQMLSLINEMVAAVPPPPEHNFDVRV